MMNSFHRSKFKCGFEVTFQVIWKAQRGQDNHGFFFCFDDQAIEAAIARHPRRHQHPPLGKMNQETLQEPPNTQDWARQASRDPSRAPRTRVSATTFNAFTAECEETRVRMTAWALGSAVEYDFSTRLAEGILDGSSMKCQGTGNIKSLRYGSFDYGGDCAPGSHRMREILTLREATAKTGFEWKPEPPPPSLRRWAWDGYSIWLREGKIWLFDVFQPGG